MQPGISIFIGNYTGTKGIDFSKRNIYILEIGKGRLTVGKIYGGLLILENWKATKFGKGGPGDPQVKFTIIYIFLKSGVIFRPELKNTGLGKLFETNSKLLPYNL